MKTAHIVPTFVYNPKYRNTALSPHLNAGYHMALAPLIWSSDKYAKWFENLSADNSQFLILDNGAFEAGKSIPPEDLATAMRDLNPNVVVIPDVIKNKADTHSSIESYLMIAKETTDTKFMVVPQAETKELWLEAYREVVELYGEHFSWIGIPKWLSAEDPYFRVDLVNYLKDGYKHHFLGCASPQELLAINTAVNMSNVSLRGTFNSRIMGMDTSLAAVFTNYTITLKGHFLEYLPSNLSRPANFFADQPSFYIDDPTAYLNLLVANLHNVASFVKGIE